MHEVHTTFIGWYGNDHHPDATHFPTLQGKLNADIKDYYLKNQAELHQWATSTTDLQRWDGKYIPQVTVLETNPYWHNNDKTRPQKRKSKAIGLETKYQFYYLARKIITAINAEQNNGHRTFIDTSMMGTDKTMDTACRQAIHRHQQYLRNTSHRVITKISRDTMRTIKSELEAIENVQYVSPADNTDKNGTWKILVNKAITEAQIGQVDQLLNNTPTSEGLIMPPKRIRQPSERYLASTRNYWSKTLGN